jgi:hypothetical protein
MKILGNYPLDSCGADSLYVPSPWAGFCQQKNLSDAGSGFGAALNS